MHLLLTLLAGCTASSPSDGWLQEDLPDMDAVDQDDSWLWESEIHEIDITLSDDAWLDLSADPYTYTMASVRIDDESRDEIGVRLRGKFGSFRELSGKPKFKLDFNRFHPGRRFFGLESLSLNNSVVDCSYLKEPLAYEVFRQAGSPAARTTFAAVTVNGEDYGLYVVAETQDDRFLDRNWEEADGNLYDGKYVWYGGYDYSFLDFEQELYPLYQLEEGEPNGHSDLEAVVDALDEAESSGDDLMDVTDGLIDWPAFHTLIAGEQWVQQNDGYALNHNNYRVYFNPSDGGMELFAWDLDYSFMTDSWGVEWDQPLGRISSMCLRDQRCRDAQLDAVTTLLDDLDVDALSDDLKGWRELTDDAAMDDPRRECSDGDVVTVRDQLERWIPVRAEQLQAYWEL